MNKLELTSVKLAADSSTFFHRIFTHSSVSKQLTSVSYTTRRALCQIFDSSKYNFCTDTCARKDLKIIL